MLEIHTNLQKKQALRLEQMLIHAANSIIKNMNILHHKIGIRQVVRRDLSLMSWIDVIPCNSGTCDPSDLASFPGREGMSEVLDEPDRDMVWH